MRSQARASGAHELCAAARTRTSFLVSLAAPALNIACRGLLPITQRDSPAALLSDCCGWTPSNGHWTGATAGLHARRYGRSLENLRRALSVARLHVPVCMLNARQKMRPDDHVGLAHRARDGAPRGRTTQFSCT